MASISPWYYMRFSIHKVLLHGAAVNSSALFPTGQMSEEAQESLNQHLNNIMNSISVRYQENPLIRMC